jgi:hypothetical protein
MMIRIISLLLLVLKGEQDRRSENVRKKKENEKETIQCSLDFGSDSFMHLAK